MGLPSGYWIVVTIVAEMLAPTKKHYCQIDSSALRKVVPERRRKIAGKIISRELYPLVRPEDSLALYKCSLLLRQLTHPVVSILSARAPPPELAAGKGAALGGNYQTITLYSHKGLLRIRVWQPKLPRYHPVLLQAIRHDRLDGRQRDTRVRRVTQRLQSSLCMRARVLPATAKRPVHARTCVAK
jgi:hypothetical protein